MLLENRRSSQGERVRTPCTLPLDPPLERNSETQVCLVLLARFTLALPRYLVRIHVTTSRPLVRLRFASKTLTIFLKYRQDNTGRVYTSNS